MEINKFDKTVFTSFASRQLKYDVMLFKNDLKLKRTEEGVNLEFFVGGEMEDARHFVFTDDSCKFFNAYYNMEKNVSKEWILYLSDEICETDEQADYFIDKYNQRIEKNINEYANKQRELKF